MAYTTWVASRLLPHWLHHLTSHMHMHMHSLSTASKPLSNQAALTCNLVLVVHLLELFISQVQLMTAHCQLLLQALYCRAGSGHDSAVKQVRQTLLKLCLLLVGQYELFLMTLKIITCRATQRGRPQHYRLTVRLGRDQAVQSAAWWRTTSKTSLQAPLDSCTSHTQPFDRLCYSGGVMVS